MFNAMVTNDNLFAQYKDSEVLAIALTGYLPNSSRECRKAIDSFEGFNACELRGSSVEEVVTRYSATKKQALAAKASAELGRRAYANDDRQVRGSREAWERVKDMQFLKEEYVRVLFLDTKKHVLDAVDMFKGGISSSVVDPRVIFRNALERGCDSILVAHNHPSGDPTPSAEDYSITRRLVESGRIIGVDVIDHIVVGGDDGVSIRRELPHVFCQKQ